QYCTQSTRQHQVCMERKDYAPLPEKFRPLPSRVNLVVTRKRDYEASGCHVVHSLEDAFAIPMQSEQEEVFVIGGADIYRHSRPYADCLYLTEFDADVECDILFPEFDRSKWKELSRVQHEADDRHRYPFDFVVYERRDELASRN